MRGLAVIGLLGALASGCLATDLPEDRYVARRHACTALEGRVFVGNSGDRLAIAADDAAYSTYEWTRADGSVTSGLVQCEIGTTATVLFADASSTISGRTMDSETFVLSHVTWRLAR